MTMGEIIESLEIDRDTVDKEVIEEEFRDTYNLVCETAVSLKKSYINKISGTKSLKLAVSLEDNSIEVYELNNTSLSKLCQLNNHKKTVTEIVFSPKEHHLVYAAEQSGVIKLWDSRAGGSCVQEYKDEDDTQRPYDCMDVTCNGRLLCAGTPLVQDDAYLVFYDQRNPKPLGGYSESHNDDITQVKFHDERPDILASGSTDGLLNIFNVMEQSEDDALEYSLNVENSVEKLSWLDSSNLACVTQCSDVQVWDRNTGDMVRSYNRDKIAKGIKRNKPDDCYAVDAFTSAGGVPTILAGSNSGEGDVLRSLTMADKKLRPRTNFVDNKQIVRCMWYENDRDLLITAGESGLISVWRKTSEGETLYKASSTLISKSSHKQRHKPY